MEKKNKRKISFDYDATLSLPRYQNLAKWHIEQGDQVWVTTARFDSEEGNFTNYGWIKGDNKDLEADCKLVGIPLDKVQYCGTDSKSHYLEGFELHYDDNFEVFHEIKNSQVDCIPIWIR